MHQLSEKVYRQIFLRRHWQTTYCVHAKDTLLQQSAIALKTYIYMKLFKIFQVSSYTGKTTLQCSWHGLKAIFYLKFSDLKERAQWWPDFRSPIAHRI